MENGVADHAEAEVSGFNDSGMNRTYGHFTHALALHLEELGVVFELAAAILRRRSGRALAMAQQRQQRRVALKINLILVMDLALVPGSRRSDGGQRGNRTIHTVLKFLVAGARHVRQIVQCHFAPGPHAEDGYQPSGRGPGGIELLEGFAQGDPGIQEIMCQSGVHCSTAIAALSMLLKGTGMVTPKITSKTAQIPMTKNSAPVLFLTGTSLTALSGEPVSILMK